MRNKRYWDLRNEGKSLPVFESDALPLKQRLQRMMCSIRHRCKHRPTYGGRGIECRVTIDDLAIAWVRDNADQMRRPSVDRIDNDGHYEPNNIRFVELSENIALGIRAYRFRVAEKLERLARIDAQAAQPQH